ncbi:MAG: hypothetical protein ACE144_04790 [Thermodesulfobacteriota bacterium]
MVSNYIERSIERVLKKAVKEFPAVVLTGPRQSGKTTTLKHLLGKDCQFYEKGYQNTKALMEKK